MANDFRWVHSIDVVRAAPHPTVLEGDVVVLVYCERNNTPHMISLRKAEMNEALYYFESAKDYSRSID
ncbi:MAG: hypothetical protein ACRERV_09645 [Methylococcales bacterium]